jgi:phytoene dehydrogenase-like protein
MIVVVGAGMGGLAAAAWLAGRGRRVLVLEARDGPGGLASDFTAEGRRFDSGPYILLDRPGLEWVFRELGTTVESHLSLRAVEDLYEVSREDGPAVRFWGSLERTSRAMDASWPGAGGRYADFVEAIARVYERLRPLQFAARPGLGALLRHGALGQIPFLFRSLAGVLSGWDLPLEVRDAITIWTHVAGQRTDEAPSPMAFVPALVHRHGAWIPEGGIASVPRALEKIARAAGAEFRYGARVRRIRRDLSVELEGETLRPEAVLSNAGIGTYLHLFEATPDPFERRLRALPLQAPGVCAYLAVEGDPGPPYLRFRLPPQGLCRLLVAGEGGAARLIGPVDHAWAEGAGAEGQRIYLERLLAEVWWQPAFTRWRLAAARVPADWGAAFHLHRAAMNPVMTARFMRQGRLAHRSPVARGLFLAGSATHPGQWVSFAAISGILSARELAC